MIYKVEFEVRDNELDVQGVVCNVNYPIYMTHARHKYLKDVLEIDFISMAKEKQNLVLTSSNIEFKKSLKAYDKFYVTCKIIPEGRIRFAFEQEIRLISDNSLIAKGFNVGVCLDGNKNRPYVPEFILKHFKIDNII